MLSLLKEHSTVFSVLLKQKKSSFFYYSSVFSNFCLDPDPKQIIPTLEKVPDPTGFGYTHCSPLLLPTDGSKSNVHVISFRHGGERLVCLHRAGHYLHRAVSHRVRLQAERQPAIGHHPADAGQPHRKHDISIIYNSLTLCTPLIFYPRPVLIRNIF